jgi:hypothetical protein
MMEEENDHEHRLLIQAYFREKDKNLNRKIKYLILVWERITDI